MHSRSLSNFNSRRIGLQFLSVKFAYLEVEYEKQSKENSMILSFNFGLFIEYLLILLQNDALFVLHSTIDKHVVVIT